MEREEYYNEEFVIYLSIDGTTYENVAIRVTDPNKTIRDQIHSIVQVFELSKTDNGGNPIQYLLGQMLEDGEESEILDFEDEDGRELCLMDYNIHPGDNLYLISVPLCGCPPIKLYVTGTASEVDGCVLEINVGWRLQGSVGTFIKYIVEAFNLPIFDDGFYIDYSLRIRDGYKMAKCENNEKLYPHINTLMRNDTSPYGTFDLMMFLSADKSKHRNRFGAMLESLYQYCGHILYKLTLK